MAQRPRARHYPKPVYRPSLRLCVVALLLWAALIGAVTWYVRP
jgi:hypothetical protein